MPIELRIPEIGESITEVEIGGWLKTEGQSVTKDEPVVTLESEKATVELPAPDSGVLGQILKPKGAIAKVGEVIPYLDKDGSETSVKEQQGKPYSKKATFSSGPENKPAEAPGVNKPSPESRVMPAGARVIAERGLRAEEIRPTGPGGRLLKEDALKSSTI